MRKMKRPVTTVIVALACLVSIPAVNVQAQSPLLSEQVPNISDQKLDQMAAAIKQVAIVKQDYEQRIATATSSSEQERIAAEADGALEKAVTDKGLSVEDFNTIIVVAQNDSDVREKIRQRLRSSR
jgi:DNA/RNA endonuclease YhcR with UshA esterase domain